MRRLRIGGPILALLALLAARPAGAAQPTPPDIVERFFKAWDKHDGGSMAALLDSEATLRRLGEEKPDASGRDGIRDLLLGVFREHPQGRVKAADRIALGPWVVARERTTLETGEPARERLLVFEVADGLVRRVWTLEAGSEGRDGLSSGEGPVALQIERRNEKDLARLLTTYDEGATLAFLSTGERLVAGEDAVRERFEKIFETSPHLRVDVPQRTALGPWVVYREHTVSGPDDQVSDTIAIYEVRAARIRRVWFLQ